ncbi:putative metallocarboxypeptidase ecm14 [Arachnomyces sp. PD_36]|nr:putative metallocarboxypeptidase ecm14 [Arachnomyces sp. PD_36]
MRVHYSALPVLLVILFCFFTSASPAGSSDSYSYPDPTPTRRQSQSHKPSGPWRWLRDFVVQTVWGVPQTSSKPLYLDHLSTSDSSAPSKLLARYGGDVVLRFYINTPDEMASLNEASNILFLDVWASTHEWVDIRIAKDVIPSLLGLLPDSLHTSHVPLIHDLAQAVYESYPSSFSTSDQDTFLHDRGTFTHSARTSFQKGSVFFQEYRPLSIIHPWMRLLASMFPSHSEVIKIGTSYEGRDILALRVGARRNADTEHRHRRKTIIVSAGAHAREWISTTTVNYAAYSFVTEFGKYSPVTTLMEEFDWVFIPTMNPDGYVYSWESDRLWRKNRQRTSLPFCPGVDLDRSWGFEWDGATTRANPCSESYAGDNPFDGVESLVLAEWARNQTRENNVDIVGFLDLHSYSQQVLYPYSYSCSSIPPTLENLEELGLGLAKAIRLTTREPYLVTAACEGGAVFDKTKESFSRMESSGGSALDWFYHQLRVRYSYQIKLRDRGSYGFLLPRENIIPTGREIYNSLLVFGRFLMDDDGFGWSQDSDSKMPLTDQTVPHFEASESDEVPDSFDQDSDGDVYDGDDEDSTEINIELRKI